MAPFGLVCLFFQLSIVFTSISDFIHIFVYLAEGNTGSGVANSVNTKAGKPSKAPVQKKDNASVAASEKRGGERVTDKDRKKDVPHPRMQFDDTSRVEKAKKRAVVKQTEVRNRVELFRHLPQYEHGTRLPDLEKKFFRLNSVHPAVYKVIFGNFVVFQTCKILRCRLLFKRFEV